MVAPVSAETIATALLNPATPVAGRMRAIFGLKGLNTPSAITALEKSLILDTSALVRHEVAYVLGQMRANSALPSLSRVLENPAEDVMVRHEAAEAMGAIGDPSAVLVLQKHAQDTEAAREVRETCLLALNRIQWETVADGKLCTGKYSSVDPAPAAKEERSVSELKELLCDGSREMFERYKAMFALRNWGGKEAVRALCAGMETERESALFRHEVAFVLGQMQHEEAVATLTRFLKNESEHEMVRHEAAEALGAVATKEAEATLAEFRKDKADIVRESVEVALDISEYAASDELHYAATIPTGGGHKTCL